jgi:hypothetical protein
LGAPLPHSFVAGGALLAPQLQLHLTLPPSLSLNMYVASQPGARVRKGTSHGSGYQAYVLSSCSGFAH